VRPLVLRISRNIGDLIAGHSNKARLIVELNAGWVGKNKVTFTVAFVTIDPLSVERGCT